MRLSSRVNRIGGAGAKAWEVHTRALQRKRAGDDIILLSIGDHDFSTEQSIKDAMQTAVVNGKTHYAAIRGIEPLRQAVADYHHRTCNDPIHPDEVSVVAGAQCGLYVSAQCVLDPGDDVIALAPTYATYEALLGAAGATMIPVPLKTDRGFYPDISAMQAAVTPKTKAILLNSPHNPTGMVIDKDALNDIADLCRKHDLWLISDEVYATLCYARDHISPRTLAGMAERTIVISSLSKSHAMTGWRVGWIVAPKALQSHVGNLLLCMLYGLPTFIQEAAITALAIDPAPMRELFHTRRDVVVNALKTVQNLDLYCPDSGMFVMVDVRKVSASAITFAEQLLEKVGVSVLPGDGFGAAGQGFVRVSLGAPEPVLEDACQRISAFVERKR